MDAVIFFYYRLYVIKSRNRGADTSNFFEKKIDLWLRSTIATVMAIKYQQVSALWEWHFTESLINRYYNIYVLTFNLVRFVNNKNNPKEMFWILYTSLKK